jgi:hypothetical protein
MIFLYNKVKHFLSLIYKNINYRYKIQYIDYIDYFVYLECLNKKKKFHIQQLFYAKNIIKSMTPYDACLIGIEYKKYLMKFELDVGNYENNLQNNLNQFNKNNL